MRDCRGCSELPVPCASKTSVSLEDFHTGNVKRDPMVSLLDLLFKVKVRQDLSTCESVLDRLAHLLSAPLDIPVHLETAHKADQKSR